MKKRISFGIVLMSSAILLAACGGGGGKTSSRSHKSSSSQAPRKSVEISNISLGNSGNKAYITVSGTQSNYTADDFKWAWGLLATENSSFHDGKARPEESDFTKVDFNNDNTFTVRYCLTDIDSMVAGTLYRIYGGTPETYDYIQFASNQFGANDETRRYYLRQDENNDL